MISASVVAGQKMAMKKSNDNPANDTLRNSDLTIIYDDKVRPMLDLVDKLRHIGIEKDLPIPQVAVMGDQSSGKSSVLEAMCGIPFPRGTGLVTRCATQIIMKRDLLGTEWSAKVKVRMFSQSQLPTFELQLHQKDSLRDIATVTCPADISDHITDLTKELIKSSGSDFSLDSIVIEVTSPDVPDLTVVDLPGMTSHHC
jgi:interferon-induced GTP-binding protein Mx1